MKKENKPIFQNGEDPQTITPLPEILPVEPPVQESDGEKEIALKQLNISEDDLLFIKNCKLQFNLNSDHSMRLWTIHLKLYGAYPAINDRYCSACLSAALQNCWNKVEPVYGKYYTQTFS